MSLPDLLAPIRSAVEALLTLLHGALASAVIDSVGGIGWIAAVALLVLVVRVLLLPLAIRQYRSGLRMQAIAPDLARVREEFRGRTDAASRRACAEETAAVQRRAGVHPVGAMAPLLIQVPLFLALVQTLEQAAHSTGTPALMSFAAAIAFGAPLAATALTGGPAAGLMGIGLLAVTAAAQVLTQHLATLGASPVPGARLLLLLPLITAATGLAFPIGVPVYWACSALFTLGQQLLLPRIVRVE